MQEFVPSREAARRAALCARCLCCLLIALVTSLLCLAQSAPKVASSDVEAAYLYNFGKFVRFPNDQGQASAPFTICILGEDAFGGTLDSLIANESIAGRKIIARRIQSPAATNGCQIVFIAQSEGPRLTRDIASFEKSPILTVSNAHGFLEQGGMIQFLVQNDRVRFAVNLSAAEQSGLVLSSELLKVAVRVDAKPAQEGK
jgi:uncharacterized protein DUF4154